MTLVYLSFAESDREFIENMIRHVKDPDYESLNFKFAPLLKHWDTENMSVKQNFILKSLKYAKKTIVFVGDETYQDTWVPVEVDLSIEFKLEVAAMRIRGSKGQIPDCLLENGIKVEDWDIEVLQYLATH